MANLDDLRYFLALARYASLVKAAESLGVSRMTVSRRIASIEEEIGARLFDKTSGGWVMTNDAVGFLAQAEDIEAIAKRLFEMHVSDSDKPENISGTVRIVTTDGFGHDVLSPWTADIYEALPNVRTEIVTTSRVSPFMTRDFDIAITVHHPNSTKVKARKLTDYTLGLYASPEYLRRFGDPQSREDLEEHNFVWFVESLHDLPELQFLRPIIPRAKIVAEFSTVNGQQAAAAAGVGIGLLPRFSADSNDRLTRVLATEVEVRRTFYLVVREVSMRLPQVQAVMEILLRRAAQERARFEGTLDVNPG
ncbi:LysR family transcriptional regulator [Cryobacterium sp. Y82]|uniref:LysR family transcriptional regulator n=1 Tax=Cryobacterium sp. Y82 TaxID=2045017 RepID=UPI000CE2D414|nr:LysR family transcriptional regulator [Cryobacterium sp. Y82]